MDPNRNGKKTRVVFDEGCMRVYGITSQTNNFPAYLKRRGATKLREADNDPA